ncbi:MAG: hypothetical protein AAF401_03905 [Pseudomonadota bacterium]
MSRLVATYAAVSISLSGALAAQPAAPTPRAEILGTRALEAYDQGDAILAAILWRLSAQQGSADSMTAYAGLLAEGDGVAQNSAEARKWYARAARRGDAHAMVLLAEILGEGPVANSLLNEAAARGHRYAQRRLAQPPGETKPAPSGGNGEDR